MERRGITASEAFERLRRQARNTNHTVTDVAEGVTLTYPLFRPPPIAPEHAAEEA